MNPRQNPSATIVPLGDAGTTQRNRFGMWFKRGLRTLFLLLVLLGTTGLGYQAVATWIDARNYLPAGQLTNVGGYMLHIHCTGAGSPTIILESGLGGTSLDWSLVQPELAKNNQVCSYDRAGLGWSEPNPTGTPRTGQSVVQDLHTLLRNTGITGPYILVGLSAGGMYVQMYANQYPEDVLGLVLLDPTPAQLMATFAEEERQRLLPSLGQFRLIQKLEPFGLLRLLPLPGSESLSKLPSETRDAIRAVNLRTGAADALYEEAAGFETSIMQTASLEPSQLPLTVIWHGIPAEPLELEPLAEASLRELVEHSKDGKFMIAENSAHYITFDRPDVVISEIKVMLDGLQLKSKSAQFYIAGK
jgi:pimeloyl-ACP methyl ester carboxylesterase